MDYSTRGCVYNAQGFLECSRNNKNRLTTTVETYVDAKVEGNFISFDEEDLVFTERPTSKSIWDKESATVICEPVCAKNNEVWTEGYRSVGGSVCYCKQRD